MNMENSRTSEMGSLILPSIPSVTLTTIVIPSPLHIIFAYHPRVRLLSILITKWISSLFSDICSSNVPHHSWTRTPMWNATDLSMNYVFVGLTINFPMWVLEPILCISWNFWIHLGVILSIRVLMSLSGETCGSNVGHKCGHPISSHQEKNPRWKLESVRYKFLKVLTVERGYPCNPVCSLPAPALFQFHPLPVTFKRSSWWPF